MRHRGITIIGLGCIGHGRTALAHAITQVLERAGEHHVIVDTKYLEEQQNFEAHKLKVIELELLKHRETMVLKPHEMPPPNPIALKEPSFFRSMSNRERQKLIKRTRK